MVILRWFFWYTVAQSFPGSHLTKLTADIVNDLPGTIPHSKQLVVFFLAQYSKPKQKRFLPQAILHCFNVTGPRRSARFSFSFGYPLQKQVPSWQLSTKLVSIWEITWFPIFPTFKLMLSKQWIMSKSNRFSYYIFPKSLPCFIHFVPFDQLITLLPSYLPKTSCSCILSFLLVKIRICSSLHFNL